MKSVRFRQYHSLRAGFIRQFRSIWHTPKIGEGRVRHVHESAEVSGSWFSLRFSRTRAPWISAMLGRSDQRRISARLARWSIRYRRLGAHAPTVTLRGVVWLPIKRRRIMSKSISFSARVTSQNYEHRARLEE